MIVIREDIADMLRAGHTQVHIVRTLRVAPITVQRTREALRLPAPKPGPRPPASFEDAFRAHAVPTEDGHARWTGPISSSNVPATWMSNKFRSAYRIAFELHHGREPVGRVKVACGMPLCVAGAHLDDRQIREANRRADTAYAAIFGGAG